MSLLSRDKQIEIIAALSEGVGIRAAAGLVGVNRETVGKLALPVGKGWSARRSKSRRTQWRG
jgi:transposase-like protein